MDPVQIVYLIGAGRSGSTLLSRLLDLEDDHFAIGEVRQLGEKKAQALPCGCGVPHSECPFWKPYVDRYQDPVLLAAWNEAVQLKTLAVARGVQRSWVPEQTSAAARELRRMYETLAESGSVLVDESKRPWLGYLLSRQPWAQVRFVELVRDPDDVVRSTMKVKNWQTVHQPEDTAKKWLRRHLTADFMRRSTDAPWLRVPYVDLANKPFEIVSTILGRTPAHLHEVDGVWTFENQENHIFLSNSDKVRRGPDAVRPSHAPSEPMSGRGPLQSAAVQVYKTVSHRPYRRGDWG